MDGFDTNMDPDPQQDQDEFGKLMKTHLGGPKPKPRKKPTVSSQARNPEDQKFRQFFEQRGWKVNRTYGRAINPGSVHPQGLAADIDPTGKSDEDAGKLIEDAIKYGYRAYDERWPQPGSRSTGPNIHFERAPAGSKPSAFHPGKYGSRTVDYLKQLDEQRRGGRPASQAKPEGEFEKLLKTLPKEETFTDLLKKPGMGVSAQDIEAPAPQPENAPPAVQGTQNQPSKPVDPYLNELKFDSGRTLTKKQADLYTDESGDEYRVNVQTDEKGNVSYTPEPMTKFTAKVQLDDGTTLTREKQVKGGYTYRAEDGTPYTYTDKGIRPAQPVNWLTDKRPPAKPLPEDQRFDDAKKEDYNKFLTQYGLKDTAARRQRFLTKTPFSKAEEAALKNPEGAQPLRQVETVTQKPAPTAQKAVTDEQIRSAGPVPQPLPNQDWQKTGTLKTANGSELKLADAEVLPEGKVARFKDENGQTYLLNSEGQLEDESLAQVVRSYPVKLVPYNQRNQVSPEDAQHRYLWQVADQIGDQQNLDKNDVFKWLQKEGLTDWETKKSLPKEQLYQSLDDVRQTNAATVPSMQAPGTPTSTSGGMTEHHLTGRQLNDLITFAENERANKESAALDLMSKGVITPEASDTAIKGILGQLGISLDPEKLRQNPMFDAATKRSYQAQLALQRVQGELQQQGMDELPAKFNAMAKLGVIPQVAADAEVNAYNEVKETLRAAAEDTARAGVAPRLGPWDKDTPKPQMPTPETINQQVLNALKLYGEKYGSFQSFVQKQKAAAAQQAAYDAQVQNDPLLKWIGKSAATAGLEFTKGLVQTFTDLERGAVVWSKPAIDLVSSLFGDHGPGWTPEMHPFYKNANEVDNFFNRVLPTDPAYASQFWQGTLPKSVASSIALMFPSMAGEKFGGEVLGRAAIGLFSTIQMGGGDYQGAKQAGASEADAQKFALLDSGLFGWTEMLGFGSIFERLNQGPAKAVWRKAFMEALKESGEEIFLNEGPQTMGNNYLASVTYDPARKWDQDLGNSLKAAGISASGVSAAITALLHLKHKRLINKMVQRNTENGGPNVMDFGEEAGFYVYGKPVEETPELKPLFDAHRAQSKELRDGFDDLDTVKQKYKNAKTGEERKKYLGQIYQIQAEQVNVAKWQQATATRIEELSGIQPPITLEAQEQAEQAKQEFVAADPANPTPGVTQPQEEEVQTQERVKVAPYATPEPKELGPGSVVTTPRGEGRIVKDSGKNWTVEFNPKVNKAGETVYQSVTPFRKGEVTELTAPELTSQEAPEPPAHRGPVKLQQEVKVAPYEAPVKREFSSTQVELPQEVSKKVTDLGKNLIKDEDLYTDPNDPSFGREQKPHITVKFGLHTDDAQEVRDVLAGQKPFEAELGKVSIFPGGKDTPYDVVKAEVTSPELHRINQKIAGALETTDTHPTYRPHVTLAYVKKGEGQKYVGDTSLQGTKVRFDNVTFSGKTGAKVTIPLGQQAAAVGGLKRAFESRVERDTYYGTRKYLQKQLDQAGYSMTPEDLEALHEQIFSYGRRRGDYTREDVRDFIRRIPEQGEQRPGLQPFINKLKRRPINPQEKEVVDKVAQQIDEYLASKNRKFKENFDPKQVAEDIYWRELGPYGTTYEDFINRVADTEEANYVKQAVDYYFTRQNRGTALTEQIPVKVSPFTEMLQQHVIGPARQLAAPLTYRTPYTVSSLLQPGFDEYRTQNKMISRETVTSMAFKTAKPLEKEVINQVLASPQFEGRKKFPFGEFELELSKQLLPIQTIYANTYNDYGQEYIKPVNGPLSYETHVWNVVGLADLTNLSHGYMAHWPDQFNKNVGSVKYEVREVLGGSGQPIYLVVPTSDSMNAAYPEMARTKAEKRTSKLNLTERNLYDLAVFSAGTRADAEEAVQGFNDMYQRNAGLFGHSRVWYTDDGKAYMVEAQGEGLQKLHYYSGQRAPAMEYTVKRDSNSTYLYSRPVSSAVELLYNHFLNLAQVDPKKVPADVQGVLDKIRKLSTEMAGLKAETLAVRLGQAGINEAVEYIIREAGPRPANTEKEELKEWNKQLSQNLSASNVRDEVIKGKIENMEGTVKRLSNVEQDFEDKLDQVPMEEMLTKAIHELDSRMTEIREKWLDAVDPIIEYVTGNDIDVHTNWDSAYNSSLDPDADEIVLSYRDPHDFKIKYISIDSFEARNFETSTQQREGVMSTDTVSNAYYHVFNQFTNDGSWGHDPTTGENLLYWDTRNAFTAHFQPGPWVEDSLWHGSPIRDDDIATHDIIQDVRDRYIQGRGIRNIEKVKTELAELKKSFESPEYKEYSQKEQELFKAWKEFPETLPLWGKQFLYHQKNFGIRLVREEIKRAAQRGLTVFHIPAPETGSMGEGHAKLGTVQDSRKNRDGQGWEPLGYNDYDSHTTEFDGKGERVTGGHIKVNDAVWKVVRSTDEMFYAYPNDEMLVTTPTGAIVSYTDEEPTYDSGADRAKATQVLEELGYYILDIPDNHTVNIMAIPQTEIGNIREFNQPTLGDPDLAYIRAKLPSSQQAIFDRYVGLAESFFKERPDAKYVTDENGHRWIETKVTDKDRTYPIALFKADLIEQHEADRTRFAEMEEFDDDFFTSVDSTVDDSGAVKLNFAAAELIRRIESNGKLNAGQDAFTPMFMAAFGRQADIKAYTSGIQDVLKQMQDAGYPKASQAGVQKLLDQLSDFKNGTGVMYVRDYALPHEKIHEARYLHAAMESSIQSYYKDFDKTFVKTKTDDGKNTVNYKAYQNYFQKVYFNGHPITGLSREEAAVVHEETFAAITDGDYQKLGLTDSEAARFIRDDLDAYVEKNGPEILDDIEVWINEKVAKFGTVEKLRAGLQASAELEKAGVSVQDQEPRGPGESRARAPADEELQGGVKDRSLPKTVGKQTALEEDDLTPFAQQLERLPRETAARDAEGWLRQQGFNDAYAQAFSMPPSAESTARRMAVLDHIDSMVERLRDQGDEGRAREWYNRLVALTNALSPQYTEYGRAIGQLARWSDLDPHAVVTHAQRQLSLQNKGELSPEQQDELRNSAKKIKELEDKITKLESRGQGISKSDILGRKRLSSQSAVTRLKEKLGSLAQVNTALKLAADKIRRLGAADSAASWINRNENNVKNWNELLNSDEGLETLKTNVNDKYQIESTDSSIKEFSKTDMNGYLDLQVGLADQGVALANPNVQRAVNLARTNRQQAVTALQNWVAGERTRVLKEWRTYIDQENEIYADDPFFREFVWTDLSTLREDRPDIPPALDRAVLAGVYERFHRGDNFSSFSKLYKQESSRNLAEAKDLTKVKVTGGEWVKIPRTASNHPDFGQNTQRLRSLSASTWCTSRGMEGSYLQKGDFWIYREDGTTELALRFDGDNVAEIQGRMNNGRIPVEYISQVTELQESGTVKFNDRAMKQIDRAKDQVVQSQKIEEWMKQEGIDKPTDKLDKLTISKIRNAETLGQAQGLYKFATGLQPWIEENNDILSKREIASVTSVTVSPEYLERRFQDLNRKVDIIRNFQKLSKRQQEDLLGLRKLPNGNYVFPHRIRILEGGIIGQPIMQRTREIPTLHLPLTKFLPKIEVFEKSVQVGKNVKLPKLRVAERNLGIEAKGVEVPNLQMVGENLFVSASAAKESLKQNKFKNLVAVGGSIGQSRSETYNGTYVDMEFPQLMRKGDVGYVKPGVRYTTEPYWWTAFKGSMSVSYEHEKFNTEEEALAEINRDPSRVYAPSYDPTGYMTPKKSYRVITVDPETGKEIRPEEKVKLDKLNVKQFGENVRKGPLLKRAEDNIEGGDDFLNYTEEAAARDQKVKDSVKEAGEHFITFKLPTEGEQKNLDDDEKEEIAITYLMNEQRKYILEHYGEDRADTANYGSGVVGPDEDGNIGVWTKVYGYGGIESSINMHNPADTLEHNFDHLDPSDSQMAEMEEYDNLNERFSLDFEKNDITEYRSILADKFLADVAAQRTLPDPDPVEMLAESYALQLEDFIKGASKKVQKLIGPIDEFLDSFEQDLIYLANQEDVEVRSNDDDDWPDLLMKVDDRPLSNLSKDVRDALTDVAEYKYLEGRMSGGQSFEDWSSAVRNELTQGGVDPSSVEGYYKALYREVLRKQKQERNQAELDRVKQRYNVTDDTAARLILMQEKEARANKVKLIKGAEKAVRPEKDKRTALQVAIDNEIEASGTTLTRDEVLEVKDRNKFFSKRITGSTAQTVNDRYLEAVNLYIDATSNLQEAREQIRAERAVRAPGQQPALTKEEVKQINKELDEARAAKSRASHELRKIIDRMVEQPKTGRERARDWYLRVNRSGEALLTATVKTAAHNVLAQRATKLINTVEQAVELGFAKMEHLSGRTVFAETGLDIPHSARFRDIANHEIKSSTFPSVQKALRDLYNGEADLISALQTVGAYKQRVVEGLLGHNPDLYDKMVGAFTYGEEAQRARPIDESFGTVSKGIEKTVRGLEKYVHYGTVLNRIQEKHFRFASFIASVAVDLKAHGIDLDQVIEEGKTADIPRAVFDRAVDKALRDTFGADMPTDSSLDQLVKSASNTASYIPFFLNPLLFRRFFYNSNRFMIEHSPLVLAKLVTKKGFSKADAAKFTVGMGMFLFALQLLRAFRSDDDDPMVLKIGGHNVRMSAYNPISTFLAAASMYDRWSNGKTILKTGDEPFLLFGIDTRYPNLALDWWKSIINLGGGEDDKYLKFGEQTKILGARGLAAFVRPLSTLKDIISHFDEMEGAVRDPGGQTVRTEIGKTVPFLATKNVPGLGAPPLPREDVMTQKPLTKNSPILDQLGVTFVNDNQIGAKFSPAEEYLDQAAAEERANRPHKFKTPDERTRSTTAAQLYTAIDKGNDVKKVALDYKKRGMLTQNQLEDVLAANAIKSTIERKAKDANLIKLSEAYMLANEGERKILRRIIIEKRESQLDSGSLTEDEKRATDDIVKPPSRPR